MSTTSKFLRRPLNPHRLVPFSSRFGATARAAAIVKPIAPPTEPKAVIRLAYYVFIFSLPFEGAIGGLFFFGLVLAGLTLCQPQFFIKAPPKAFWYFLTYMCVAAVLGLLVVVDAPQNTELTRQFAWQLFRFFQFLVFLWIGYNLMMVESIGEQAWLTFAVACVLSAILQVTGVIGIERAQGRMSTFGDNPNVVATVLGIGLLSLIGLLYGRKNTSTKMRLFVWLTSGFLLVAMVRTGSRGNLLACLLALIALTVRPSAIIERMKTILIASVVITSVAVAAYQIDAVRVRWEKTYYEGDVAGRERLVPVAWEMFLEKPIFGWGPVAHAHEMAGRVGSKYLRGDPHNVYLWVLIETGLVGALPFFIGLWLCCRSVWHARRSVHGSLPLALLLFLLVINLKGTYLYYKVFWVILAYAVASGCYAVASSRNRLQAFPAMAKVRGRRPQMRKSFT